MRAVTYSAVGLIGFGQSDVAEKCPGVIFGKTPTNDYCPFSRVLWSDTDVYVMRLTVDGVPEIQTTSQALKWANAYGESLLNVPGIGVQRQDVRALVLQPQSAQGVWKIEVVVTTPDAGVPIAQRTAAGMIEQLELNSDLRAQWPNFRVTGFQSLQLLRNVADMAASPVVWSWQLAEKFGSGKTEAYGRGEGVWLGGTAARPQARMAVHVEPPIAPPKNGPPSPGPTAGGITAATVVGVVLVGAFAWTVLVRPQQRKAS